MSMTFQKFVFVTFRGAAINAFYLKKIGVTHVLNTGNHQSKEKIFSTHGGKKIALLVLSRLQLRGKGGV